VFCEPLKLPRRASVLAWRCSLLSGARRVEFLIIVTITTTNDNVVIVIITTNPVVHAAPLGRARSRRVMRRRRPPARQANEDETLEQTREGRRGLPA
jgi:hypothetical protein